MLPFGQVSSKNSSANNPHLCPTQHASGNASPTESSKRKNRNKTKKCTNPANRPRDLPEPLSPVLNLGVLNRSTKTLPRQEHLLYLMEIKPRLKKPSNLLSSLHIRIFRISHCYRPIPCEFKPITVFVGVFFGKRNAQQQQQQNKVTLLNTWSCQKIMGILSAGRFFFPSYLTRWPLHQSLKVIPWFIMHMSFQFF